MLQKILYHKHSSHRKPWDQTTHLFDRIVSLLNIPPFFYEINENKIVIIL